MATLAQDQAGMAVRTKFLRFLNGFTVSDFMNGPPTGESVSGQYLYYIDVMNDMLAKRMTTLSVDFSHVLSFDGILAHEVIEQEFFRYEPFLRKAVQNFVDQHKPEAVQDETGPREFYVSFFNMPNKLALRDLRTDCLGSLVSFTGTITRSSEVRPELLFGAFRCLECSTIIRHVEQQFQYTKPVICSNATCNNRDKWELIREECQFVDWQRVRVQENSNEIPAGSLPRTMEVILRHDIVESARAGDKSLFTGTLIVVPDILGIPRSGEKQKSLGPSGGSGSRRRSTPGNDGVRGIKALGVKELNYRLCFLANSVKSMNSQGDKDADELGLNDEEQEEIDKLTALPRQVLYEKLINSIAPNVFGHAEIKRAILLMLLGGIQKKTAKEGIRLRGDINMCIVGDPSCAKSQFLKFVAKLVPRAVYTSGKSSSAAGLTASVVREPDTGEFCIEAGALMLADNGVCCIDEFDKMDIKDQVAIHEAMEQQTISVTKAGVQATLNARASVFAAANPSGGRYDRSKPLKYNLNIPAPIMSRFDLVHVMVDEPDENIDYSIARHILGVHRGDKGPSTAPMSPEELLRYIQYAKGLTPKLSEKAREALIVSYVSLRSGDALPGSRSAYRITVRQLEALIRLSEALAKMTANKEVSEWHVKEAKRLLRMSIITVATDDITIPDVDADERELEENQEALEAALGSKDQGEKAALSESSDHEQGEDGEDADGGEKVKKRKLDQSEAGVESKRPKAVEHTRAREQSDTKKLHITQEKLQRITSLLVQRLQQQQDAQDAADPGSGPGGISEPPASSAQTQPRAEDSQAHTATVSPLPGSPVGMKQVDLVNWALTYAVDSGTITSEEELLHEMRVLRSIVNYLIKKEAVLIDISPGEIENNDERVLIVNPNYSLY